MVNLNIENPPALKGIFTFYPNYHPINVSIVVYDITERHSFEDAMKFVYAFTQEARPGAFVALVGNKADLKSRREVSFKVSNVNNTMLTRHMSTSDVGTSQVTFSQH